MRARVELKNVEQCIHGGINYEELKKFNLLEDKIIDFSTNINPLGPPLNVLDNLKNVKIDKYPDSQCLRLREYLAKFHKIKIDNILVGAGSTELIYLIGLTYLNNNDRVIILKPTFSEYEKVAKIMGSKIIFFELKEEEEFTIDANKLCKLIKKVNPKIVFLCNPNNPTGKYINEDAIRRVMNATNNKQSLIVLDEAYVDFVNDKWNSIELLNDNLIILRSLTKIYALAGLRIGYCIAPPSIINDLNKVKMPWNVNTIAQYAAILVLKNKKYIIDTKKCINSAKEYLINELRKLNFKVIDSDCNFILVKVNNATVFRLKLLKEGILVRDCSSFSLPNFIRISVRNKPDCEKLIQTIRKIIAK